MRVVPLLLLSSLVVACAKDAPPVVDVVSEPQQVTITATDFGYELPGTPIRAGLMTITLVNHGEEIHHVTLIRLQDGKTVGDFMTAIATPGPVPDWAVAVGGPNGAPPGGEANATLVLEPGTHVVACFIPSPDGVPHFAKGMIMGLEVQPGNGASAALPPGDIDVGLLEYGFAMSQTPTAGTRSFTVTNQGKEPHEVVLVRLAPGMTAEQVGAWIEAGEQGPPPGEPIGGLSGMSPGQVENFSADLTPGTYGFICFVPAPDGVPHFAHGMVATFTVS
jgi:hypothetical protein